MSGSAGQSVSGAEGGVLAVIYVLFFVALIWFLFDRRRFRDRIDQLELRIGELQLLIEQLGRSTGAPSQDSEPDLPEPSAVSATQSDSVPEQSVETAPEAEAAAAAASVTPQSTVPQTASVIEPTEPSGPVALEQFGRWARQNWFYLVAAASLALAGVFLIQYGMERGLLSPPVRIAFAVAFGGGLLFVAEWLRRRGGDGAEDPLAYLPSTLAAAGIVTLFAATWGAFGLYGFGHPSFILALLAILGFFSIGLGWFYGPLLSGLGVVGSIVAPFIIGGESDAAFVLNYYFLLVLGAGLGIDAFKRWNWLSVLSVASGLAGAVLLNFADLNAAHFYTFLCLTSVAAIAVPMLSVWPEHQGTPLSIRLLGTLSEPPEDGDRFPARLSLGTVAAAVLLVLITQQFSPFSYVTGLVAFGVLLALSFVWTYRAPALVDLALTVSIGFLLFGLAQGDFQRLELLFGAPSVVTGTRAARLTNELGGFLGLATLAAAVAAIRSVMPQERVQLMWTLLAVCLLPFAAFVAEIGWWPSRFLGDSVWGLVLAAIAALMAGLARRYEVRNGGDRKRMSYALVSAVTMVSFALVVALGESALTLALSAMVGVSLLLDRRFQVPLLSYVAVVGAIWVSSRLIFFPGLPWALTADWLEMTLVYAGSIALLSLGLYGIATDARPWVRGVLESIVWVLAGILVSLLIYRWFDSLDLQSRHWMYGLLGLVWLLAGAGQFYRVKLGGSLEAFRWFMAAVFSVFAASSFLVLFTRANPLGLPQETVVGPVFFNSLFVSFALPAALLGFVANQFTHLKREFRIGFWTASGILGAFYLITAIRHLWRGPDIRLPGIDDTELYSYTVAMIIVSAGMLFIALWRRKVTLRRVALVALGITAAKVFLIDAAGLTGLTRVFSFLALGLVLTALAWLDRRFGRDAGRPEQS